jgi:hypothetical protein
MYRGEAFPRLEVGQSKLVPLLAGAAAVAGELGKHKFAEYDIDIAAHHGSLGQQDNRVIISVPDATSRSASVSLTANEWGATVRGGASFATGEGIQAVAATPDTLFDLMYRVAERAADIPRQTPWSLLEATGLSGREVLRVPPTGFIPVAAQLVNMLGTAIKQPSEGTLIESRLALHFNSAGSAYGPATWKREGVLYFSNNNPAARTQMVFRMAYRPSVDRPVEHCSVTCSLDRMDRNGSRSRLTRDTLLQEGVHLRGLRTVRVGGDQPRVVREYVASADTIMHMAQAAIIAERRE